MYLKVYQYSGERKYAQYSEEHICMLTYIDIQ